MDSSQEKGFRRRKEGKKKADDVRSSANSHVVHDAIYLTLIVYYIEPSKSSKS